MTNKILGSYLMFLVFIFVTGYFLGPLGSVWYFIGWSIGAIYIYIRYRKSVPPSALKPYWNVSQAIYLAIMSWFFRSGEMSGVSAVVYFGLLFPFVQILLVGFVHPYDNKEDTSSLLTINKNLLLGAYVSVVLVFAGLVLYNHFEKLRVDKVVQQMLDEEAQGTFSGFKTSEQLSKIEGSFKCQSSGDNGMYVSRVLNEPKLANHRPKMELIVKKELRRIFDSSIWNEKDHRSFSNLDECLKALRKSVDPQLTKISFFTDLIKFESDVREGLDRAAKLEKILSDFYQSQNDVRRLNEELDKVKWIRGYMVGELAPNQYEVDIFGKRILLKTKITSFQSKGLFFMNVVKTGSIDTKLSERAGGFTATIDVYEEVLDFEKNKALVAEYRRQSKSLNQEVSSSMQSNWKEKIFPYAQEFYTKWLDKIPERAISSE